MSKLKEKRFKENVSVFPFLKRLFSYTFKYKNWMKGFIFFVLMVTLVEAVTPLVWLNLLDNAIVPLVEKYKDFYAKGINPEEKFELINNLKKSQL